MDTTINPASVQPPHDAMVGQELARQCGITTDDLNAVAHVAHTRLAAGAVEEAQKIYAILVVLEPAQTGYQVGLADAAMLAGNADLALQAAAAIISIAPADPRGYFLSGRACLALGMLDEAREDLSEAIDLARTGRDSAMFEKANAMLTRIPTG